METTFQVFSIERLCISLSQGLPRWLNGKESSCQSRRHKRHGFAPWVEKIPWSRKWQPTPVFLPGKSHEHRILVGDSPGVHKGSDMTEHTPIYVSKPLKWDVSLYLTGTTCFKLILQYLFLCTEKLAMCVCLCVCIKFGWKFLNNCFFKLHSVNFFLIFIFLTTRAVLAFNHYSFSEDWQGGFQCKTRCKHNYHECLQWKGVISAE